MCFSIVAYDEYTKLTLELSISSEILNQFLISRIDTYVSIVNVNTPWLIECSIHQLSGLDVRSSQIYESVS